MNGESTSRVSQEDLQVLRKRVKELEKTSRSLEKELKSLRESEQRNKGCFEDTPYPVMEVDGTGRFERVNPAASAVTGYSEETLRGMSVSDLLSEDGRQEGLRWVGALKRWDPQDTVLRCTKKDGTRLDLDFHAVGASDGRYMCFCGESRKAPSDAQRWMNLILEHSSDGINLIEEDPETEKRRLMWCNDRFVEITGRTREELERAEDLRQFTRGRIEITPEDQEENKRRLELKEKGLPYRGVSSWIRPDGKENYFEWAGVLVKLDQKRYIIGVDHDITDHVVSDRALRESQATMQALLDAAAERAVLRGLDGTILATNEAMARAFGKSVSEIIGKKTYELVGPEMARRRRKFHEQAVRERRAVRFLDEREGRWLDHNVYPIPDADGEITRLAIFTQDITERKLAQEALRAAKERLQYVIDNSWDVISQVNMNGDYVFANKAAERVTGYTVAELLIMNQRDLIAPEYVPAVVDRWTRRLGGEQLSREFALEIIRKNGKRAWLELTVTGVYQNGKLVGVQSIGRDVTEPRQIGRSLRESESRYRSLVESMNEGMVLQEGREITYVNDNFCRMLGYTKEELLGRKPGLMLDQEDRRQLLARIDDPDLGRRSVYGAKWKKKDGTVLETVTSLTRLRNDKGEQIGVVALVMDISERIRAGELLRKSEARHRSLVESMNEGMILQEGREITYVNDNFCRMLGYSSEELLGRQPGPLLDQDDRKTLGKRMHDSDPSRRSFYGARWKKKDGTMLPTITSMTMLLDETGKRVGTIAMVMDISGQMETEQALRRSEQRYKRLVETMIEGVILGEGNESRIVYANEGICRMLGTGEAELMGTRMQSHVVREDRQRIIDMWNAQETAEHSVYGVRWIRKDGTVILTVTSMAHLFTEGERRRGAVAVITDISQQVEVENALRTSEERYRSFFESSSLSLWEFDLSAVKTGIDKLRKSRVKDLRKYLIARPERTRELIEAAKLLDVNDATIELLDAGGKEEILAEPIRVFLHELSREGIVEALVSLSEGRTTFEREITIETAKGETRFVVSRWSILPMHKETWSSVLIAFSDVTLNRLARRALEAAHHNLMSAREQERRRLAGELHDSIGQSLVALKLRLQSDSSMAKAGRRTTRPEGNGDAVDICDELISDVRQLCYGLYPPALESAGLIPALRQLAEHIRPQMHVAVRANQSARTRRFPPDIEIAAFRITQEALSNAARHSRGERVEVRLNHSKKQLTLQITDNGIGFDKDEALGRGLGLNTMRERARGTGGDFKIRSQPGKTMLIAYLPAEPVPVSGK